MISAKMPPESDLKLRKVVLKNLIYSSCGDLNPSAVFMAKSDKKDSSDFCLKRFLESMEEETKCSETVYYVMY